MQPTTGKWEDQMADTAAVRARMKATLCRYPDRAPTNAKTMLLGRDDKRGGWSWGVRRNSHPLSADDILAYGQRLLVIIPIPDQYADAEADALIMAFVPGQYL